MRRSRRMTSSERWELGLFLAMLIVACLCVTAVLNLSALPNIFALRNSPDASVTPTQAAPTLEIAPQTPALLPATLMLPGGGMAVPTLPLPADQAALSPALTFQPTPKPKAIPKAPKPDVKTFNGQKYRFVKTIKLRVTAYAPDPRCTYPFPGTTTASGMSVKTNGGRLVAADTSLIPLHSLVSVPGYAGGSTVPVLDRGGAIKGSRLDILLPTFDQAKNWGSKTLEVKVYQPIDE